MKALMEGPFGTPFEGGVFLLDILLPRDYPFKPPRITFETPIFHCNVSGSGRICLDLITDRWSPAHTIPECLQAIRALLSSPNTQDALRPEITELYIADSRGTDARYLVQAQAATRTHASRTVEEWTTLWGIPLIPPDTFNSLSSGRIYDS
jgi:ubiquitin-conjugating enzyme E2 D